ncbi:MAG: hypothetical protein Q8M16_19420 [Pirellulaceae bacterium]|nr:hypothetical protein [Pirellulaceae bacterium]
MLNRVRDFRYEDIKNWKPLVSLRESYRKESAVRNMILFATCIFAIIVGYSAINGTLRFSNKTADAATGDSSGAGLSTGKPLKESDPSPPAINANLVTDDKEIRPLPAAPNRGNHRPASYVEPSVQADPRSTPTSTSQSTTVRNPRIAVCDVQLILAAELAAYSNELVQTSEQQLFTEQEWIRQNVAQFTEVEVLILQKLFEQKKNLAVNEIREQMRQYRESADRELQVIADQIAQQGDFDLVVTTDHVLSFTQSNDITRIVKHKWDQRRQNQAQVERPSPFPRR